MTNYKEIEKLLRNYNENKKRRFKLENYDSVLMVKEKENDYRNEKLEDIERELYIAELLLNSLNEKERKLITMKYIEDKSVMFVSDSLYISKSTMYRRITNAFEKMQNKAKELYNIYPELFK